MTSIIDQIRRDYEARFGQPRDELIEAGRVRDFLLAMDEPATFSSDEQVPALFLLTLARTRRPQPAKGTSVNAGDEYEFFAPVYVGDRITVSRRVIGVEEKQGKANLMWLIRVEANYHNQRGEIVARAKSCLLRWGL